MDCIVDRQVWSDSKLDYLRESRTEKPISGRFLNGLISQTRVRERPVLDHLRRSSRHFGNSYTATRSWSVVFGSDCFVLAFLIDGEFPIALFWQLKGRDVDR
jgi:hypothetical protein